MGEYCKAICLGNSADHLVCLGFDMFHKSGAAAFEVAAEGVLAVFGSAFSGKQAGEVGTAYLISGNLGQLLAGYGDAESLEALQYPLVAVVPGLLQAGEKGEEFWMLMVEAVAQNMERNSIEGAAYFYSRENFYSRDCAVGKCFRDSRDGVVIGEGYSCKPPAGGKGKQGRRGQQAV